MWLRIKLTAVFAACIALPLGLVLCAVWVGGNESLRMFAERDLKAATQTVAATIEARLALDLTHLKTFGGLPVMQDVLIADGGGDIGRVLTELKTQYPEFVELTVTDARGVVIAATSKSDIGRPAAAEEGFRSAASGTVYQGPLVVRDAPAKTTVSFTVPLAAGYDRQTVIGTLFGVVDFAVLVKAAKAQSILASDQNVVLVARRQDGRTGFATRADGALIDAVQGVTNGAGEISWRAASYFVSSAPSKGKGLVRDPGFIVRTVAPAETALGAVDQMLTIAATVAVMGGILALAFAWRWATPLVQLGTAMGRVAHGEAARAPQVAPTNTFAPLARSFESLRQTKAMHTWLVGRERELLREKEAAERALHEKSEHLASLSRALKGQLATIVELSEAINSQALTSATGLSRANQAKDISRSGMQLLAVINDLFELSEAEAGRSPLRDGDIDLAALVRESVDVMRDAAHKARIFLACDGADEELLVRADAQKMKQVMFNLLSNAVKFTPEHGRVHVTLKTDVNGRPAIVIADTGIGMPATLTPLASPFSPVDDANTHGRHGAGLGLPLARQLVEMHGGTLEIESEAGKGTTVTVALPVQRLIAKTEDAALLIA
ncbi:MAG: ATP-binding protein [Alphaproteobacteria bacterium]|nr:ATP-binding protein [Alphaproteobacteria bacterium]